MNDNPSSGTAKNLSKKAMERGKGDNTTCENGGSRKRQRLSRIGFTDLPLECRVHALNFLDPDSLALASLVSKGFREDCLNDGIENPKFPVYEITPRTPSRSGHGLSYSALYERLRHNHVHNNAKFSRYRHLRVNITDLRRTWFNKECDNTDNEIRLEGITSLDISLSERTDRPCAEINSLLRILPNIQEIDVSNTLCRMLLLQWNTLLEKFTGNGMTQVKLNGYEFRNCSLLKEVHLDGATFDISKYDTQFEKCSDLTNHNDTFLLSHCKSLQCVSMRNANYTVYDPKKKFEPIPQNALIKFVRNAPPSLCWFRSHLTPENIAMLQRERPEIEFC